VLGEGEGAGYDVRILSVLLRQFLFCQVIFVYGDAEALPEVGVAYHVECLLSRYPRTMVVGGEGGRREVARPSWFLLTEDLRR